MLNAAKRRWRELRNGSPGSRFRDYYDRHRGSGTRRIVLVATGLLVLVVGLVMLPAPGPGMIVVALAAGILAQSSRWTAALLDRVELLGRPVAERLLEWWRNAAPAVRIASAVLALVVAAGVVIGGYQVFMG